MNLKKMVLKTLEDLVERGQITQKLYTMVGGLGISATGMSGL